MRAGRSKSIRDDCWRIAIVVIALLPALARSARDRLECRQFVCAIGSVRVRRTRRAERTVAGIEIVDDRPQYGDCSENNREV